MQSTLIFAHRGAVLEASENTRTVFARALAYPIDGSKTENRLSREEIVKTLGMKVDILIPDDPPKALQCAIGRDPDGLRPGLSTIGTPIVTPIHER